MNKSKKTRWNSSKQRRRRKKNWTQTAELLERRELLAFDVLQSGAQLTFNDVDSGANSRLYLGVNGEGYVTFNGATTTTLASSVASVTVNANDGDDNVDLRAITTSLFGDLSTVEVFGARVWMQSSDPRS
ncbi:MAG: hypothetical protein AAF497_03845 [Planctomycetota bacterium]